MTKFQMLQKRIERDTGLKLVGFGRTYAGFHQRSIGCWTWGAFLESGHDIGSCYSATELLKARKPLKVFTALRYPEITCDNQERAAGKKKKMTS